MTELDESIMRNMQAVAALLMNPGNSPLDLLILIPVWRNGEGEDFKSGPVLIGNPDAIRYSVAVLRELIDRIERGDYALVSTTQNSPGGSG